MQVLVVMAGKGQRFIDAGYSTPKPIIDVDGKTMVRRTAESLPFVMELNPSKLTFAVLKEHRDEWAIDEILKKEFGESINIVEMPELTRGNLETAYIAACQIKQDSYKEHETLIILDSDNVYNGAGLERFLTGPRAAFTKEDGWACICDFDPIDDETHWCFAESDGDSNIFVKKLHEKTEEGRNLGRPMVGTFVFSSLKLFLSAAGAVLDQNETAAGEYYLSQAVQFLLDQEYPVYRFPVSDVQPLGTPEYLKKFRSPSEVKLRICFDLDDTILHCKAPGEQYGNEDPQPKAIETLKRLHAEGHYIIIYTARHMNTCSGNVGMVLARQGMNTLKWLERWEVPYDEIHFGKPHADIFIDDKAFRHNGDWKETEQFIRRFQRGDVE